MADVFTTTADLLQLGDGNISDINVSELLEDAPVLAIMFAQQASYETTHEWLKKTVAPAVGFRAINDGRENDKATYAKVIKILELFDASFSIDQGLLQSKSGESLKRREAVDHMKAAFADLEGQLLNGTIGGSADGFDGFADEASVDDSDDPMVINAGGAVADVQTSVWLVRNNEEACSVVYGLDAKISIGEEYPAIMPGSVTGHYDAMRTPILWYAALQVATTLDLGRICNLDAVATLTDKLISEAIALFPSQRKPNFLAMTRQSQQQLQDSRTATNPTGAPAPFPESAFNIPIITTDQLTNTEAIVTAA
jgi:hypothetical protein